MFHGCYEAVLRYAARRVPPEAVQDVVSETFLVAWRRRVELDGEPLPWLLGIARRVAANARRGGRRRDALRRRLQGQRPDAVAADIAEPDHGAGGRDPRLAAALASLRAQDREALILIAWEGLDHRQAATVMGCSTGAFTVRLHRARRKLERALAREAPSPIDICEEARSPL